MHRPRDTHGDVLHIVPFSEEQRITSRCACTDDPGCHVDALFALQSLPSFSRGCLAAGMTLACLFLRQNSQTPNTRIVRGTVTAGKYHTRGETSSVAFPVSSVPALKNAMLKTACSGISYIQQDQRTLSVGIRGRNCRISRKSCGNMVLMWQNVPR